VPDPAVWDRIAGEIEPSSHGRSRLEEFVGRRLASWFGDGNGFGWFNDAPTWVSLRGATVLSMLFVAGFVVSGVIGGPGSHNLDGHWRISTTRGNPHDLAFAELAIQQEYAPRAVDRTLPGGGAPQVVPASYSRDLSARRLDDAPPREAYNRSVWLRPAPAPRSGPVTPLEFLNGQ
jgi:hypothetical protein